MGELEQLTRLSEILNSSSLEETAEQDEFREMLKKFQRMWYLRTSYLDLSMLLQNGIVIIR